MSRISKQAFVYLVVSFCVCTGVFWSVKNASTSQIFIHDEQKIERVFPKVAIGIVSCRKKDDEKSNIESAVLIKSVLISAMIYNVKEVNFYIFLEHDQDSLFFENVLQEYGFPNENVTVSMFFYSAVDVVPKRFWSKMIYDKTFRCGYSRLYFSQELNDVDSIIYMDTDFIVTGNILELWNHFGKMNDHQLIAVSPNNEPETLPVNYKMTDCFRDKVPFVQPIGLNSGLLLMNLTRMREYKWEDRVSRTFKDYSKIAVVDDQVILNIILYYDPGLLYILPCQFNIRCSPCNHALLCKDVKEDPYGIQSIHGAYNQFEPSGRFFYIFKKYKEFDITKQDVIKDLMVPITQTEEPKSKKGDQKCDQTVNEYLFRNILRINNTI